MAYPRIDKYTEAIQNYQKFIIDKELSTGKLAKTGFGLPIVISGGFALTYTIETKDKKFAVRCFHKESKNLEFRYKEISKKINSLKSDYFVKFEFQQEGIIVGGSRYPLVKMEWAKGETLGEFIENNYDNASKLKNLLGAIVKLSDFIESHDIAHGDIQPGNLMIADQGNTIKLIDYDGMYIDSLASLGSSELGHINFQHPQRKNTNPFNSKLDRFSFIMLWMSINALVEDSKIWKKTNSDMDSFVFTANDYNDPEKSSVFQLLSTNLSLEKHIKVFGYICQQAINNTPSLDSFINREMNEASIKSNTRITTSALSGDMYYSQYPVLDANNYDKCLESMGDQVEVVGRITDVKVAKSIAGKPYIFLNFGDWRDDIFKVTIWSEGIDKIDDIPDRSWIGKWISIKGLMEPPYNNPKFNYNHLTITVNKNNQLSVISQKEYDRRINAKNYNHSNSQDMASDALTTKCKTDAISIKDNAKVIESLIGNKVQPKLKKPVKTNNIVKKTTSRKSTTISTSSSSTKNKDILKEIKSANKVTSSTNSNSYATRAQASQTANIPVKVSSTNRKPNVNPTSNVGSQLQQSPKIKPYSSSSNNNLEESKSSKADGSNVFGVIFWIVIIIILIKSCA